MDYKPVVVKYFLLNKNQVSNFDNRNGVYQYANRGHKPSTPNKLSKNENNGYTEHPPGSYYDKHNQERIYDRSITRDRLTKLPKPDNYQSFKNDHAEKLKTSTNIDYNNAKFECTEKHNEN